MNNKSKKALGHILTMLLLCSLIFICIRQLYRFAKDDITNSIANEVSIINKEEPKITKKNDSDLLNTDTLSISDVSMLGGGKFSLGGNNKLMFPIKVYTSFDVTSREIKYLKDVLLQLNRAFDNVDILFEIVSVERFKFPYIDILKEDNYELYYQLSKKLDSKDTMSLWIVENDESKICDITEYGSSCYRVGGWTNVANTVTANIVINKFSLRDSDVVIHEFGHFFGLDHTFEKDKYGAERKDDCENTGDRICDTPPDPNVSDVFISYRECECFYKDFKPMINNFMAYYGKCTFRGKKFTQEQYIRIYLIANTLHRHFAREIKDYY